MSDERGRQIGANEALFRAVNEQIERLDVVCECGDLDCAERIPIPISDYEEVRADSVLFLVKPGHQKPDIEEVVSEAPGYYVVRKRSGEPARVAVETDPRS